MGKRKSIYEQKLKMLLEEFLPLEGLSGLNIRLRRFGRCMNLVEVNDFFTTLLDRLKDGEIVMDECLEYEEWYDADRWKFSREKCRYDVGDGNMVKSLVNSMQNYKVNENNKISNTDVRDKLQTSMSIITSQNYLSDEELDEICYEGVKKLLATLKEIHEISLYHSPSNEAFINVSSSYREMADKRWLKYCELGKEYQKWKNQHLDLEVDDLVDYRGLLIKRILNCEFCNGNNDNFKLRDNDKQKYIEELRDCEELADLNNEMLRRYAYLRRIYAFDGKRYYIKNEEKLGKHLYIHRKSLTDDDICEFYLLTSVVEKVQKEMNFAEIVPDNDDAEALLWYNLRKAGIVDYHNIPVNMDLEERGLLAKEIGNALHIKDKWKYCGEKWGDDRESLRKAFDRKWEKEDAVDLINKYQKIFGLNQSAE